MYSTRSEKSTAKVAEDFWRDGSGYGSRERSGDWSRDRSGNIGSFNNNDSNNITGSYNNTVVTYNYSTLPHVPTTLEELVRDNRWGVSPPEIDLDYLRDPYNLPKNGTGEWIFEDEGYKKWQSGEESELLWLCGGPGTGKTMLAKRVAAKFLEGPSDPSKSVKFVHHFVSPELPTGVISTDEAQLLQRRLSKVPWELLYGILLQNRSLFDRCKVDLEYQRDALFTNPGSLWKILRKAIQDCGPKPVYILIDGIDEFEESISKELVDRILGLMTIRGVKIFLSSRNFPHLSNHPSSRTEINLDTNSSARGDVETFIRGRVNGLRNWEVHQKDRVIKALLDKSEGIFLWASLAIENLSFYAGVGYEDYLKKFPPELKGVYRKMLGDLSSGGASGKVLDVILHVALALRPLKFDELGYMLALMEEDKAKSTQQRACGETRPKTQPKTRAEIKQYIQSSRSFLREKPPDYVSIVHHTATKYLFDEASRGGIQVSHKSKLDFRVSWQCFLYLHCAFADPGQSPNRNDKEGHDSFQEPSPERARQGDLEEPPWEVARRNPQGAVAQWPYLRYAAGSWFIHARRSIETTDDESWGDSTRNWLEHQFFTSGAIRKPWIKLCGDPKMEVLAGDQTPLHVAVCLGLTPLVEKALSTFKVGPNGTNNQSPLHLAAKSMSGTYKILIAKGSTSLLTAPDEHGNTPLHEAAISGHILMLAGLVEKFATPKYKAYSDQINQRNKFGDTPLHLAFQFDHPDIVKFLVENHADLAITNSQGLTASKLGEELGRGDSLDILKDAERIRETEKEVVARGARSGTIGTDEESEPLLSDVPSNVWVGIFCCFLLAVWMDT
ncbi:hypothetical protein HOY82DRAFT_639166 [Tuber indicum]|nr:hypothetical protein HOY82DRAFT_639166 [Tuber indicum]